jgi:tetratricopeptide (TPR) repeat protein
MKHAINIVLFMAMFLTLANLSFCDTADASCKSDNAKLAKGDSDGAIALRPEMAFLPYNNRGLVKKIEGDLEGAIEDYTKAIQLKSNYVDAYYNRGDAKRAKGDMDGAIANHTKAMQIKRESSRQSGASGAR